MVAIHYNLTIQPLWNGYSNQLQLPNTICLLVSGYLINK